MGRLILLLTVLATEFGYIFSQDIEVITQERTLGVITILTYSPDGSLVASGSAKENSIKIWDINSGKIIGKLNGHEGATTALLFNEDGTKLYSSAKDELIISWNLLNWEIEDSVKAETALTSMVRLNEKLYCGGRNGKVYEFSKSDLSQNRVLFDQDLPITKVDVNNKFLVSGTAGGRLTVYNLEKNQEVRSKKIHLTGIKGLQFIDNGEGLITTGGGGVVHIWKINDLENSIHLKATSSSIAAFDANEAKGFFVVASENKEVKVYDFKGSMLGDFKPKQEEYDQSKPIDAISISPNGSTVVSSGFRRFRSRKHRIDNNVIRVWDVKRGALMSTLEGTVNPIFTFDFHPTENRLVTLGEDRSVAFWNLNEAEKFNEFQLNEVKREKAPPRNVKGKGKRALRVADKFLSGASLMDVITSGDVGIGTKAVQRVKRAFKEEMIMKYSASGKYLVTKLPKDEIRMYDLSGEEPRFKSSLWSYQSLINGFVFSPSDEVMAVLGAGDSAISLINLSTGEFLKKLTTPLPDGNNQYLFEARSASFSPDGKYLAAVFSNGKTYVYETKYWSITFENQIANNLGFSRSNFVNFSEDGKYLVASTAIGTFKYETGTFVPQITDPIDFGSFMASIERPFNYAVGVKKNRLYFKDIITGESAESMAVHPREITNIAITKNGKVGMTLLSGQFFLFDPKTGKEEVQFVAEDDNYIFKTAENYYKVSKEGYELVTFRIGNRAYPFEQFDAVYNRPDLVLQKLHCEDDDLIKAYERAYQKRITKLGLTPTDKVDFSDIPTTNVLNLAEIPAVTSQDQITVDFRFEDRKGLLSYNIYLNNVPQYGKLGRKIQGAKEYQTSEEMFLVHGTNKIQIAAQNKNGVESLMQTFYVDKNGDEPKPNLYLITIGTSEYADKNYDLNYAVKDAKDLTSILSSNTKSIYESVKTKSLYNESVTRKNILELKSFLSTSSPDDIVILFVAGHGVLDSQFDYYFGTHNIDFQKPAINGLPYEELEGLLDGIKANRKILIMDTCHSGEVDKDEVIEAEIIEEDNGEIEFRAAGVNVAEKKGAGSSASKLAEELFNDLRRGTGSTVISSAGGAEFAMESDKWKNGLFTYCLLNGLENYTADLDEDGQIMLSELQDYVVAKVAGLSHGRQVPNTRIQNIELDFRVW